MNTNMSMDSMNQSYSSQVSDMRHSISKSLHSLAQQREEFKESMKKLSDANDRYENQLWKISLDLKHQREDAKDLPKGVKDAGGRRTEAQLGKISPDLEHQCDKLSMELKHHHEEYMKFAGNFNDAHHRHKAQRSRHSALFLEIRLMLRSQYEDIQRGIRLSDGEA